MTLNLHKNGNVLSKDGIGLSKGGNALSKGGFDVCHPLGQSSIG